MLTPLEEAGIYPGEAGRCVVDFIWLIATAFSPKIGIDGFSVDHTFNGLINLLKLIDIDTYEFMT